ncbi:hypothetical protein ACFQZC_12925 [Streptacidiphilus monticola]
MALRVIEALPLDRRGAPVEHLVRRLALPAPPCWPGSTNCAHSEWSSAKERTGG